MHRSCSKQTKTENEEHTSWYDINIDVNSSCDDDDRKKQKKL